MSKIAFEAGEPQVETVWAFLMLVLEYATEIGLFSLVERLLHVTMTTVRYPLLSQAQTVIASLVLGGAQTKAINATRGEEVAAANYLGLPRFPDQSQINRSLPRFTEANVRAWGDVQTRVLRQQSQARRAAGLLVVDSDQCGVVANGQTYEFHRKGYFPRKRGEEGYQVSRAYLGADEEAIQLYLDPGQAHCPHRLADLLREGARLLGPEDTAIALLRRRDAGYDSAANRQMLAGLPGYAVLKGASSELARRLAQRVAVQEWRPVAADVHGVEVTPDETGLRRLVYELHQADGTVDDALLYTSHTRRPRPPGAWAGSLPATYNERTTIEAFIAAARHGYNIQNLRSRTFHAIDAFLRFVVLTHNLLHWAKQARLAQTTLLSATTRHVVCYVARVRAPMRGDGHGHLRILPSSRWATLLIEALTWPPHPVQLALPFASF